MNMDAQLPIDAQIRMNLARYFAGEMTLDEFENWFVPATWDIERRGNPAAESLAADVLFALSQGTLSAEWAARIARIARIATIATNTL